MAKVNIRRLDGTHIMIEGHPQEIAELVRKIEGGAVGVKTKKNETNSKVPHGKESLVDLLNGLIDGGFFKKPKELSAIKTALAEVGHVYPVTTISPALLRLVRKRLLRRIKQNQRWFYTGS